MTVTPFAGIFTPFVVPSASPFEGIASPVRDRRATTSTGPSNAWPPIIASAPPISKASGKAGFSIRFTARVEAPLFAMT